jgi:hypothetical protein
MLDVAFTANGTISSATAVSPLTITGGPDFEGIAYTSAARDSVFVSEETTPTVREFKLSSGEQLQTISLPDVFENARDNRGLEALTRSVDGGMMWTANEEALTVDGPDSSPTQSNTVRLQQLVDHGTTVALRPQFAYQVDPIHAGSGGGNDRSGLPDLAMLPDDTLIALERSAAAALPPFRSRIYELDFAGATNVAGEEFASGLAGASFVPVAKTLLWSGAVGTLTNGNLEGIGLGPVLDSGNWVLLGVLDNGGSGSNLLVSFELSLNGCSLAGDYNCNGAVDGSDYTLWKNTFGSTTALAADGNGNGTVDAADYTAWRNALGATASGLVISVPEPAAMALLLLAGLIVGMGRSLC